jgi:hypothetical protein
MAFITDKETGKIMDQERNAVLESVRGYSTGDKEWSINWNGEIFSFMARDIKTYGGDTKNIPIAIEWLVTSMKIPKHLEEKRSEIMGMIKESLEVRGIGAGFAGPSIVEFDPRLIR